MQGGWQKLYDLNKSVLVKGPDLILPGQTLALSGTAATPSAAPAKAAPAKPAAAPAAKSAAKSAAKAAPQDAQRSSRSATRSALPATNNTPAVTTTSYGSGSLQALAASIVPADQLASFDQIITHESGWNVSATNPSSGAYGLPQALPGNKMASAGADWRTNPATQIKWALNYMNTTYGSPNQAWAFWQTHSAY